MDDNGLLEREIGPHSAAEPTSPSARQRRVSEGEADQDGRLSRRATLKDLATTADLTGQSDPDTCRICRGEATQDEPLFYPCKCSGSIKYVHQDCLMEWLSHSQKKHCELCKTPFRFTKLYAPNMPKSVPFYVFISHITKYLFRNILVWLRAALVLMVWVLWLPYTMRIVWSFLFWVSDEGLGGGDPLYGKPGQMESTVMDLAGLTLTRVCPASPLLVQSTTPASLRNIMDQIPLDRIPLLTTTVYGINITNVDPLPGMVLRAVFGGSFFGSGAVQVNTPTPLLANTSASAVPDHPTLLSNVKFLHKISPSPNLASHIIAIFEGQVITILVIICFILIILVRDYVVQQQPEINMRAAFAAQENAQQPPAPPEPAAGIEPADIDRLRGPEHPDIDALQQQEGIERNGPLEPGMDGAAPDEYPQPRPAAELFRGHDRVRRQVSLREQRQHQDRLLHERHRRQDGASDEVPDDEVSSAVGDYMRLYREAGGDADEIARLAKQENIEDKLAYWIELTHALQDRKGLGLDPIENGEASDSVTATSTRADYAASNSAASEAKWGWPDDLQEGDSEPSAKGKEKAVDQPSGAAWADEIQAFAGSPSRPRSATDGPQPNGNVNRWGKDYWAPEIPQEPTPDDSNPVGIPVPAHEPVEDTPGPETKTEEYASAPSSTAAESGSLSVRDGTPRSSEESERPADGPSDPVAGGNDTVEESSTALAVRESAEWENLPDFNDFPDVQDAVVEAVAAAHPPHQPAGLAGRFADFMWGDVDAIDPNEPHPLLDDQFLAHDDDLPDFINNNDDNDDDDDDDDEDDQDEGRDQEVMEAAAAAGIDAEAEAIEDAEDLEGILELVGMRGPVAGLFQNAIFCAFLVSITIFLGVFIPYNIGRFAVWSIANPMRPVRILFSAATFVQDVALLAFGICYTFSLWMFQVSLFMVGARSQLVAEWITGWWAMCENAAARILDSFVMDLPLISASEIRNFSAVSHGALILVKERIGLVFNLVGSAVVFVVGGDYLSKAADTASFATNATELLWDGLKYLPDVLSNPGSWVIDLNTSEQLEAVNVELASWNAMDRVWAIFGGYVSMCVVAGLYLRRGSPFSSSQIGQEWEASIIDGLNQASGVMKVILIIGIEMLIFPLYCGLLLDIALLPLFENTTIMSRVMFTLNYPLTSIFVHWFVGTGYMFHFALFVSMCRKIMRKGVLYFIRDPDDPEFHPVRDVLERNVTTQLRKILFSAFVYGALVIVCLGGVVWGLAFAAPDVLPIHYSSNEPVLEFPIDLLFYNFLMPLAVKFFKPSDGLHAMYTWWFRKCARGLRISWFLFGERRIDEEGTIRLNPASQIQKLPWWKTQLLELSDKGEVIPKTWKDTFDGGKAKPAPTITAEEMERLNTLKSTLVESQQLIPNGRFVRAPASDQVKIPKGWRVFLDVDNANSRIDANAARTAGYTDLFDTNQFQFVYVPPHFRTRIFLFIMFIWMFAAITGVGFTIIPLVFGRRMFQMLIPDHIRTNDIYAFSIGIYILGSAAYLTFHIGTMYMRFRERMRDTASALFDRETLKRVKVVAIKAAKLTYAYFFLLVVFPLMVSSLMELYILIPLDTYMYSAIRTTNPDPTMNQVEAQLVGVHNPRHTIRAMQSWTIGVIYLKLVARVVQSWYRHTRLAAATRAVLRRGWFEPDVKVLTRAFVVPGLLLWFAAVFGPLLLATLFIAYNGGSASGPNEAALVLVYRFCFVAALVCVVALGVLRSMVGVFRSWRVRIRDEAYLIGERLHNFGLVQSMHDRQERERRRTRVRWHAD